MLCILLFYRKEKFFHTVVLQTRVVGEAGWDQMMRTTSIQPVRTKRHFYLQLSCVASRFRITLASKFVLSYKTVILIDYTFISFRFALL